MLTISELYIYPIKSLGGIAVQEAQLTDRGFAYDRRWMLIDTAGNFLSQRELPAMALLRVCIEQDYLLVQHSNQPGNQLRIPLHTTECNTITVQIWDDTCRAVHVNTAADTWFSEILSVSCRLVYMPDDSQRLVEMKYARNNELTSFSDGYPLLIIGQSSLDDLNNKLNTALPVNRFRPNIVFTGGAAFEEDNMKEFEMGGITFYAVKPCARCTVTTIDQHTAIKGKEPLTTLSTYRRRDNKILFGQNLLHKGTGSVHVGDVITIIQ